MAYSIQCGGKSCEASDSRKSRANFMALKPLVPIFNLSSIAMLNPLVVVVDVKSNSSNVESSYDRHQIPWLTTRRRDVSSLSVGK